MLDKTNNTPSVSQKLLSLIFLSQIDLFWNQNVYYFLINISGRIITIRNYIEFTTTSNFREFKIISKYAYFLILNWSI